MLWSSKVKEIASHRCEYCLNDACRLESAHIIGRNHRTTRWGCWIDDTYDLNGMCLCVDCHQHYDQHKQKHDPIRRIVIGQERYEKLCEQGNVIAKNQVYENIKNWIEQA